MGGVDIVKIMATMSCENWLYALLLAAIATQLSTAGDFDKCKIFTPIAEANYSTDPALVTAVRGRPLGYDWSVIPFNDPQRTNPCFTVHFSDSKAQTIEVMAQDATGSSTFCVKSNRPDAQATCQSGIRTCKGSPVGDGINEMKYVFSCIGCETDITFWFRFTVSPSFDDGVKLENWCGRTSQYPRSLIPEPPDIPDASTPPTSGSCFVSRTFLWLLSLSFAFCFFCKHY